LHGYYTVFLIFNTFHFPSRILSAATTLCDSQTYV